MLERERPDPKAWPSATNESSVVITILILDRASMLCQ